MRQQISTSSPAAVNCESNPPILASAAFEKTMLQPARCSARSSATSTWQGAPGGAPHPPPIHPCSCGAYFGPPHPSKLFSTIERIISVSQCGSTTQSESVYAINSPRAACIPTLRATLNPLLG